MNRRDFLKGAFLLAALTPVSRLAAAVGNAVKKMVTRRRFRDTELTLPMLGFGMMRLPKKGEEIDHARCEELFRCAIDHGVNYFDTAYMYHGGKSEKCVGAVLSKFPRASYYLADKMPIGWCRSAADVERIFKEQLERTRAGYFDFYLAHALNANSWKTFEKFGVWDFLVKMKAAGKIRHIGFSFHDRPEVLETIAAAHPWEFVQLQINYLDWNNYRSREQYEIAEKYHLPVIVMEPLRGGALTHLNPKSRAILKSADPAASPARWAFRYVGSLPSAVVILSGMSQMKHLEENIETFTDFQPLTDIERSALNRSLNAARKQAAIPCTNCRYCVPCKVSIDIPAVFAAYNDYKASGNKQKFLRAYKKFGECDAAACVGCKRCVRKCPQHIPIVAKMKEIAREVAALRAAK